MLEFSNCVTPHILAENFIGLTKVMCANKITNHQKSKILQFSLISASVTSIVMNNTIYKLFKKGQTGNILTGIECFTDGLVQLRIHGVSYNNYLRK